MDNRYTCTEIAIDFELWGEYADPMGTISKPKFEKMSIAEKTDALHYMFPGECNCATDQ